MWVQSLGGEDLLEEDLLSQSNRLQYSYLENTHGLRISIASCPSKCPTSLRDLPTSLSSAGDPSGQGLGSKISVRVLAAQSCLILCDLMDFSPPGFSVHGISQARIMEWVAISLSRGSSRPRDQTQVSHIAGRFFTA